MKALPRIHIRVARRVIHPFVAAILLVSVALPLFSFGHAAAAATQLTTRSIEMSDSGVQGGVASGVGSGLNVTYRFTFTAATTAQSLVVDFCQESPIIGDTNCTAPTGLDVSAAAVAAVAGPIGGAGWSHIFSTSQIKLAGDPTHTFGPSDSVTGNEVFDITGIKNPNTVATFYARIYTYQNNSFGGYSSVSSLGTCGPSPAYDPASCYLDYGGIALTTTRTISITARVQEQLTFCVTSSDPVNWTTAGPNIHSCSDAVVVSNPPTLTLGTGSPPVLAATNVDTGNVFTQISTNATHGVIVRIRNSNTTCGGLSADSGTSCQIPATNAGSGAGATQIQAGATSGTAAFGLFASNGYDDPGTGGGPTLNTINSNTCTAAAAYHTTSHAHFDPNHIADADTWYGMDTTTANNNVESTFGSTLMSCTGAVYHVDNAYQFAATPALSTPAGIYTANMNMIATSTF